ncbi:hypothetical protein TNCV_1041421 [Trichonephila clavipes]|nr:hypothetical protein TNCV_1041421 [Trichonephila clavipes]
MMKFVGFDLAFAHQEALVTETTDLEVFVFACLGNRMRDDSSRRDTHYEVSGVTFGSLHLQIPSADPPHDIGPIVLETGGDPKGEVGRGGQESPGERTDGRRRRKKSRRRKKRVGEREREARLEWRKGLSPEIGVKKTMNAEGVEGSSRCATEDLPCRGLTQVRYINAGMMLKLGQWGTNSNVVFIINMSFKTASLYAKSVQSVYITPILQRYRRSSSVLPFHSNIGPPSFRTLLSSSLDPWQGSSSVS